MNEKEKDRIEERFDGFETSLNSLAGQMGTMGRAQEGFYQRHEERSENIKDDVKEIKTDIKVIHTDISGHETRITKVETKYSEKEKRKKAIKESRFNGWSIFFATATILLAILSFWQ